VEIFLKKANTTNTPDREGLAVAWILSITAKIRVQGPEQGVIKLK